MAHERASELLGRFLFKTNMLTQSLASPLPMDPGERDRCDPIHLESRAFLVIRLVALWGEFSRMLVVRSALGDFELVSGQLISPAPGIRKMDDVRSNAKEDIDGTRAHWHWPTFALTVAQNLRLVNYNQINLGLGSANISELVSVRNFIVHPSKNSRVPFENASRSLGVTSTRPDAVLTARRPGGATVFETWVADLQNSGRNAVA